MRKCSAKPLARVWIESQPKMRDEQHADNTYRPQEAEDYGDRQRQLSEEQQRVDAGQQRNDGIGDPPMELAGSVRG